MAYGLDTAATTAVGVQSHRAGVPKGRISVNAENGVVFLRGVMDRREQIDRMGAVTRGIRGVGAVENLVHTPGTPAPPSRPRLVRERTGT